MKFHFIFSLQYSISINTFEVDPLLDSLHDDEVKTNNRHAIMNLCMSQSKPQPPPGQWRDLVGII
jgi:hypothetical protein